MKRKSTDKKNLAYLWQNPLALLWNLALVYVVFLICRIVFLWVNIKYFPDLSFDELKLIFAGGLRFDTSAILYSNLVYILLLILPLHARERKGYQLGAKIYFIVANSLCILANLMDTVYFAYTNRRTTSTIFSEFSKEGNLGAIFGREVVNHWYLTLLAIVLIAALWYFYRGIKPVQKKTQSWVYYPVQTLFMVLFIPLVVFGLRGGPSRAIRPITISNAAQYVDHPLAGAIVLNTPFSIYRTLGNAVFKDPAYMPEEEMVRVFDPVHIPNPQHPFQAKNVVVIILESFSQEFVGSLNKDLEGGKYKGYTPFLDSLITNHALTYTNSFRNGRKSIDAMPSVLSGIPMFVEPFVLTSYSANKVGGLAQSLRQKGYYSAFFHGADNESMGFQAFARATGFQNYYGYTEYCADPNYNGDKDFDGVWAIWDEEFMQFFCDRINEFKQPFVTGLFSATSHHPFNIPERYRKIYPEEGMIIHKSIRYSDNALKQFFKKASKQPWFENTIFVLCADHQNISDHAEYQNELGSLRVPIIFYAPGDPELKGRREGISQQIDIMPTVLGYLGYDQPYFAFGCDLLHTPPEQQFDVCYLNGVYQYIKGDFLLQFDGEKPLGVYNIHEDKFLKTNLLGKLPVQGIMERELKAIIQQYMQRMLSNRISLDSDERK